MPVHHRAPVGPVAVEDRFEQLGLVVDRVAEGWHAVEDEVPNAQGVREVTLEGLSEVRVASSLPRVAVNPFVEAHQALLLSGAVECLDIPAEFLGGGACVWVEAERGQLGGVASSSARTSVMF